MLVHSAKETFDSRYSNIHNYRTVPTHPASTPRPWDSQYLPIITEATPGTFSTSTVGSTTQYAAGYRNHVLNLLLIGGSRRAAGSS